MKEHLPRILRCPITKGALREMNMNEIKEANSRISKGELFHFDGTPVKREIRSGFVSLDGQFAYPVEEEIVIMLESLAIVLSKEVADRSYGNGLGKEKRNVKDFYDQVGWQKGEEEVFVDTLKHYDLRPVSKDYLHKCHLRVSRHIKPGGKYFLDVASGPITHPEYLSYSNGFDIRICVDLSFLALKEARRKLGDKGIYILADITNLPLEDNLVDSVVSLHTIYHVPRDEQGKALHEIYRVLEPGSSAVVVYSWGPLVFFTKAMIITAQKIRPITRKIRAITSTSTSKGNNLRSKEFPESSGANLYFHSHNYKWFTSQTWGFDFDILPWRSVSPLFLKTFIHNWLFGKQILALLYWLEERFPYLAGRLGQYPMFVIKK